MHDDDFDELRASLALVRLAWPQLVTVLVQIGKRFEKIKIDRMPYR